MTEQLRHVIFDLDGTLVDSAPGVVWAIKAACHHVCPAKPYSYVEQLIGPPIRMIFQRLFSDLDNATMESLICYYRRTYDTEGWRQTSIYPGVMEVLTELKSAGVSCWGVTNKPAIPTRLVLEHFQMNNYFGEFLSIDSHGLPFASKIEATQSLIARHDIIASATVFIGDTLEDANTAAECKLRFLAFCGGYGWPGIQQHFPQCKSFSNFEHLVRMLADGMD